MPKVELECYEINIKVLMRKEYWDKKRNGKISEEKIIEMVEAGMETIFEKAEVKIDE